MFVPCFNWISFYLDFSTNDITIQAYTRFVLVYVPDPTQDQRGCKFTNCPIVAGQQHSLVYPYNVSSSKFYLPVIILINVSNFDIRLEVDPSETV